MSKISDENLIKAAIEGDTEAVDMLKDRIKSAALPTIKKRGIQGSDKDEKVLESQIVEKVLNALPKYGFKVSLETWVYRITVNMVIQHQRRVMMTGRLQPQSLNGNNS